MVMADIIKLAMIRVSKRLKAEGLDAKLLLQIHDELIVEVRKDMAERAAEIVSEEMRKAAELPVSLEVETNIGMNWYEAH